MTPESFITQYKNALKSQDWKAVEPLMHKNIGVSFSDGSVHLGIAEVQRAFQRNFSIIKNEDYEVINIRWLLKNESNAVYLFEFSWKGIIQGQVAEGNGIGTAVLIKEDDKWYLLSEHLGKKIRK